MKEQSNKVSYTTIHPSHDFIFCNFFCEGPPFQVLRAWQYGYP